MYADPREEAPAQRISAVLRAIAGAGPDRISLGEVAAALEDRSFGILVLCLALPNAVPGPYIPGLSAIMALPIVWLGVQLIFGHDHAELPWFLRRRSITRIRLVRFVDRAEPLLGRLEGWLRPRPGWLTGARGHRLLGLALVVYGFALSLPIPLGNLPVAVGITVLALGLIEEDSRALALGLVSGLIGCLWDAALIAVGTGVIEHLWPYL